jgi:hypothetical protein
MIGMKERVQAQESCSKVRWTAVSRLDTITTRCPNVRTQLAIFLWLSFRASRSRPLYICLVSTIKACCRDTPIFFRSGTRSN